METVSTRTRAVPIHGWIGLGLALLFWVLNWTLPGLRTHWAFFPMWLGYCLVVDALTLVRKGTSLLTRGGRKYIGLFLVSVPAWWLFEAINGRVQNWFYHGAEYFTPLEFFLLSTLCFSTVIPAVFGSAELASTFAWIQRLGRGPVVRPTRLVLALFFITGWLMFLLLWAWPEVFFPFVWLSVYFILEPVNVWLGNRSLARYTVRGDWRPIVALWVGVLIAAFFWEMWNYFSYPKWMYEVPWVGYFHLFEMPALGYGGYLPFALELYALYHLILGIAGQRRTDYVQIESAEGETTPAGQRMSRR